MGVLRLATNYIEVTGQVGFHYGHLQIVYESGDSSQEIEVQSPVGAHWGELGFFAYPGIQDHLDPNNTSGTTDPNKYQIATLDTGDRDPDDVWALLREIHEQFVMDSPNFEYGLGQNSNSYAATLLWMIGIDVSSYLSAVTPPLVADGYPGADRNILTDGTVVLNVPYSFDLELIATDAADFLRTGNGDDTLSGMAGDDELIGGEGSDLLVGGSGSDLLNGGGGSDTVDYSGQSGQVDSPITSGIHASVVANSTVGNQASVTDSWGDTDTLVDVENVVGTAFDDVVSITGSFAASTDTEDLLQGGFDLGGQAEHGDTVVLTNLNEPGGVEASLDDNDLLSVTEHGGIVDDGLYVEGVENVIGTGGDDNITGNGGDNILVGGGGYDQIDGGAGDDIIVFDAADVDYDNDLHPVGGADWDVGYVEGSVGVEIEMDVAELEVVVGGSGDDDIAVWGNGPHSIVMAAGGDGDDTFWATDSDTTAVVWGGSGSDSFYFGPTAGIMVVNVAGLTTENFADFDLDMLNLGAGFDWSMIDAVVINPDASDEFHMWSYDEGWFVPLGVDSFTYEVWDSPGQTVAEGPLVWVEDYPTLPGDDPAPGHWEPTTTITPDPEEQIGTVELSISEEQMAIYEYYLTQGLNPGEAAAEVRVAGVFETSFLGSSITSVQTDVDAYLNPNAASSEFDVHQTFAWTGLSSFTEEVYYDLMFDPQYGHQGVSELGDITLNQTSDLSNWFVIGGTFTGDNLSSNGSLSVTMAGSDANSVFAWLDDVGYSGDLPSQSDGKGPQNQAATSGNDSFSAATDDGIMIVSGFSVADDTVVLDGTELDPNAPSGAIEVSQQGLNTVVSFGNGDLVILEGVDLASWQTASSGYVIGTSAAEIVNGDNRDNVIDALEGDDTINAGDGNDTILGSAGSDQIFGGDGTDVVDYSTSASAVTVVLHSSGAQSGGDGEGDVLTSIEGLVGSDFDDALAGSSANETLNGGAGNDTLWGHGGDDVFVYSGDDDVIENGNSGFDTLDLSQYSADQVSFSISGHDVLITTPDGEIELDYQMRYAVGHSASNIESVLFSDGTLDEAGIRQRALDDQSTAGNDVISGSIQADVIVDGLGNDTIFAGNGDDMITYVSGNDIIENGNSGFDTLDLSLYSADQVSFSISGHDVLITTPDGEIELDYQVRYAVGHSASNIESILFSDGTLDEAGIRQRALNDQSTAGDDVISGSIQADMIVDGLGNDTIFAGNGDDMITYVSGNDIIENGNSGFDTLDLSQYSADQVSFSISGHDVLITTPDGEIELDYQMRYAVGHSASNIESILFSDGALDEAGIRQRALDDQSTAGDDTIVGSISDDIFYVGAGNDTISSGQGSDTFVFAGTGDAGINTITDFDLAQDGFEIAGQNFASLTISDQSGDTLISWNSGSVNLLGVDSSLVTEDLFMFV